MRQLCLSFGCAIYLAMWVLPANLACISQQSLISPNNVGPGSEVQAQQPVKTDKVWEEKRRRLNQRTKYYTKNKLDILLALLEKASSEQLKFELERVRTASTDYAQMTEYDQTLLQAFVVRLLRQKDKNGLIYLLSAKSLRSIASNAIELAMAIDDADNILILFDSYEKSISVDARNILLDALSSAFKDLRKQYKNDNEFIEASKKWYLENRARVKVNPYYYPSESSLSTRELFVYKTCAPT